MSYILNYLISSGEKDMLIISSLFDKFRIHNDRRRGVDKKWPYKLEQQLAIRLRSDKQQFQ